MGKSTKSTKIEKPYPTFPLFPHSTGRWAKKILGKRHYFGSTADDLDGAKALEKFNREWPFLSQGRTPPKTTDGDACSIKGLCDAFMTSKKRMMESDELSPHSFSGYLNTCQRIVDHFGRDRRVDDLMPSDFEEFRSVLAKNVSKVTLKNEVNRTRMVMKYAFDQSLIERPVKFGQSFDRPSGKAMRKARRESVERIYTREELLAILKKCDVYMKAMMLLGLNCGFGNTDVACLPQSAVNLETGWISYPRPKTEINRLIPLWPETVEALKVALVKRLKHNRKEDADVCFITEYGNRWVRTTQSIKNKDKFSTVNTVATCFSITCRRAGVEKPGVSFYALRHVFETIGGESRDQVAVDSIMGHAPKSDDMASVYRHGISEDRLKAVVNTVRSWLWPDKA